MLTRDWEREYVHTSGLPASKRRTYRIGNGFHWVFVSFLLLFNYSHSLLHTSLACWSDSPTNAVEIVQNHITKNHSVSIHSSNCNFQSVDVDQGHVLSRWHVQVRTYRPSVDPKQQFQGLHQQIPPRSMVTVTMNDALFVLIEDPSVPIHDPQTPGSPDVPLAAGDQEQTLPEFINPVPTEDPQQITHRRTSYVVIRPPESLDLLLNQLQAKWVPSRQSSSNLTSKSQGIIGGPHVTIEGLVFSVGTDWIIRAGNIMLAGGTTRGMLLEVCIL